LIGATMGRDLTAISAAEAPPLNERPNKIPNAGFNRTCMQCPLRGHGMARTCFNSILDGAAEFCDAEWPSRRCDARFSRVRCVLATSLTTKKDSEKVVFESPLRDVFSSSASLRYLRSQVACSPREDDEGDDQ
jgi:hypothetical protein